jgi:adenylate kinase family enzyme
MSDRPGGANDVGARIAIVASASGNGKTTIGLLLAHRLDVPFTELDALVHGRNWAETSDEELRARITPILAGEKWVIDGSYQRKLGDLVLRSADTIVWLDLPVRVWLTRLVRRTLRRLRRRELLWNDNRETVRAAFWGRQSLVGYSLRIHFERRKRYPLELAPYRVIRLRSQREVDRWLKTVAPPLERTSDP